MAGKSDARQGQSAAERTQDDNSEYETTGRMIPANDRPPIPIPRDGKDVGAAFTRIEKLRGEKE